MEGRQDADVILKTPRNDLFTLLTVSFFLFQVFRLSSYESLLAYQCCGITYVTYEGIYERKFIVRVALTVYKSFYSLFI